MGATGFAPTSGYRRNQENPPAQSLLTVNLYEADSSTCHGKCSTNFRSFFHFAETKILAALVLDVLNQDTVRVPIQKEAVGYELSVLKSSTNAAWVALSEPIAGNKRQMWEWRKLFRLEVIARFVKQNKHTLVQHPVGFHQDVFKKGKQCLENKFCFVVHGNHKDDPMGRGGQGMSKFVVAILDWAN